MVRITLLPNVIKINLVFLFEMKFSFDFLKSKAFINYFPLFICSFLLFDIHGYDYLPYFL